MRIYVAGVIAAGGTLSRAEMITNCDAFDVTAARLRALGHDVVNPVEVWDPRAHDVEPSLRGHHDAMRRDLAALITCDAIYMQSGWLRSTGAELELRVARGLGMSIFGVGVPSSTGLRVLVDVEPPGVWVAETS